jgi:molybdate transport system permease protein
MDLTPLWISLKTAFTATLFAFFLGILAARCLAFYDGKWRGLLDGLFIMPLVLPPTVVGFLLLVLFGRNGPIGRILEALGTSVLFSWPAAVIAATVVAFPIMYRTALGAFEQVDYNLLSAARTLKASEWDIFRRVLIPLAWPGIAAGTVLSFARALGEFGATLMLAGNIPGKTQTIPIAIYFAVEGGRREAAALWVLIIITISLLTLWGLNYWSRNGNFLFSHGGRR